MACFKELSRHSSEETEEIQVIPLSGLFVTQLSFKLGIFQLQV